MDPNKKFEHYVKRLSLSKEKHPVFFAIKLVLLIITGFYFLFVLLGLEIFMLIVMSYGLAFAGPIGVVVWILIAIAFVKTLYALFQFITYRPQNPEGIELKRSDFPEIWALIEKQRRQLRCAKIHKILLIHQLNAYVIQVPKWGIFGNYENNLCIGLPLLSVMDEKQAQSILAHELGHISRNHSKLTGWVIRMNDLWDKLIQAIMENSIAGDEIFVSFYLWYTKKLGAMTLVMRQAQEKDADRDAAKLCGAQRFAEGLGILQLLTYSQKKGFWIDYYKEAAQQEMPSDIYGYYEEFFNKILPEEREAAYQAISQVKTCYTDSHPSYRERVEAVSASLICPCPPLVSAKNQWFTASAIKNFEESWKQACRVSWETKRIEALRATEHLSTFSEELTPEKAKAMLLHSRKTQGYQASLDLADEIHQKIPYEPTANYYLGSHKAFCGDPDCLELLMFAVNRDYRLLGKVCYVMDTFYYYQGKPELSESFREKYASAFTRYSQYYEYLAEGIWPLPHCDGKKDLQLKNEIQLKLKNLKIKAKCYWAKKRELENSEGVYIIILDKIFRAKNKKLYEEFFEQLRLLAAGYDVHILLMNRSHIYEKKYLKKIRKNLDPLMSKKAG